MKLVANKIPTWHRPLMQKCWPSSLHFVPSGNSQWLEMDPPSGPALKQWIWQEEVFCASPNGKISGSNRLAWRQIFSTLPLKSSSQLISLSEHKMNFSSLPMQPRPPFWGAGLSQCLTAFLRPRILEPDWQEQSEYLDQDDQCPSIFFGTINVADPDEGNNSSSGSIRFFLVQTPLLHHCNKTV